MSKQEQGYPTSELREVESVLRSDTASQNQIDKALLTLNNWRTMHYYPMFVFYMRLKNISKKVGNGTLVALRLKRVPSIIAKLRRNYGGKDPFISLYRMQDIGGCRIIVSNVATAQKICQDYYLKGDLKHKRIRVTNYIDKPKADGYRSIHIIYRYKSDKASKQKYNGLLVEVQIRSKLQHIWATAVEMVGFFTRQAIKSNVGDPNWMEFFRLVSSAFAKMEGCPMVPGTTDDEETLYSKIKSMEKELKVINNLEGWARAMNIFGDEIKKRGKGTLFLLELDIVGRKLDVYNYSEKQKSKAIEKYAELEKRHRENKEYDVVLAGADDAYDLKLAYPNYYVDTDEFIRNLKKIVEK